MSEKEIKRFERLLKMSRAKATELRYRLNRWSLYRLCKHGIRGTDDDPKYYDDRRKLQLATNRANEKFREEHPNF